MLNSKHKQTSLSRYTRKLLLFTVVLVAIFTARDIALAAELSSAPILSITSSYDSYGQTRGVLKDGEYVYIADGTVGLVVLRITEYNSFIKVASLPMGGSGHAYSFAKSGSYLYMAAREEGIFVINISNPSSPSLVNIIPPEDLPGTTSFLTIDQDLLLVSSGHHLVILNISDPENPFEVSRSEGSSIQLHLIVENDLVYIAQYDRGFRIIDISDPSLPSQLSETRPGFSIRCLAKQGNSLFVGGGGSGLLVYNISDPFNPSHINSVSLQDEGQGSPYSILGWENFLFIADGSNGLQIVDITTPQTPVLVDTVDTPGSAWGLFVDGIQLFIADEFGGVHLLDIFETTDVDGDGVIDGDDAFKNDPTEWIDTDGDGTGNNADMDDDNDGVLDINDAFPTDSTEWLDTDNDGVGDNSDIFPLDSSEWADSDLDGLGDNSDPVNSFSMTLASSFDSVFGQSRGTLKDGNIIYVADGTSGLLVLQMAEDASLSEIGSYVLTNGGSTRSLYLVDNYLYMACRDEGLLVLDVSDPANPALVYTYDTPDMATFLTVDGSTLYLSDRNSLQIFDILNPEAPVWLSELAAYSEFEHIVVDNNIAYIAGYYHGLFMINVSDPNNPELLKNTGGTGYGMWAVEKHGNYAYIGGESSGIYVFNVADPYNPSLVTIVDLPSSGETATTLDQPPFHMKAVGSYLFVADGAYGIQVLDISDPASPVIQTEFNIPENAWDFSIDGYIMVIGDYHNGIHMVNFVSTDDDGDAYSVNDGDCDDNDPSINPGTTEIPYDGIDQNCSGGDLTDVDGDGYDSIVVGGTDCNDSNPLISPETYWFADSDTDYYGDPAVSLQQCTQPTGYVTNNTDCDDTNSAVNPATYWYIDNDSDNYGSTTVSMQQCSQPTGYVLDCTDCNDNDPDILDTSPPVRITDASNTYYSSLQSAFNAALDGQTVQVRGMELTESPSYDQNISTTFEAGYNCGYTSNAGTTTLNGSLTITSGMVTIQSGTLEIR